MLGQPTLWCLDWTRLELFIRSKYKVLERESRFPRAHAFPCLIWLTRRYRQRSWRHDSFLCHVWIITAGRLELALFRCPHHPPRSSFIVVAVRFYRSALIHDFSPDCSRLNPPPWHTRLNYETLSFHPDAEYRVPVRSLKAAKEFHQQQRINTKRGGGGCIMMWFPSL